MALSLSWSLLWLWNGNAVLCSCGSCVALNIIRVLAWRSNRLRIGQNRNSDAIESQTNRLFMLCADRETLPSDLPYETSHSRWHVRIGLQTMEKGIALSHMLGVL